MRIENIKCLNVQAEGDKLTVTLSETSFGQIEAELTGKRELSVWTDNGDEPQLVEKHYDFAKADSCKYDYETGNYTLTLRKLTQVEKEVEQLKAAMAKLLESTPATA